MYRAGDADDAIAAAEKECDEEEKRGRQRGKSFLHQRG